MKDLMRIKKRRSEKNADITLYYTCTAIAIDGEWKYNKHEPKPIKGNCLTLNDSWVESIRDVNFDFAVHEQSEGGTYIKSKQKTLSLIHNIGFEENYATLCIEKTRQEFRSEMIEAVLKS